MKILKPHMFIAPRVAGGGQPDNDTLDVETPLSLSDGPADEPCISINTTNVHLYSSCVKQVRLASPCQNPDIDLSTPPYTCNGDGKRNIVEPKSCDSDESRDGTISLKRQKPSAPRVLRQP